MENVATFPNRSAIKEEAGGWITRMDQGALHKDEIAALQVWIGRSDFHREYLLKLATNWDAMGVLEEFAQLFPSPESEPLREHSTRWDSLLAWFKSHRYLPLVTLATAVSLMLSIILLNEGLLFSQETERYLETAVGEQSRFTLNDGSTVLLNTNSKIQINYSGERRAITLLQGEANFDVAKNPERPFVVYASTGMVWAVGTAFNVRYTIGAMDVTVTEGTVKVFSEIKIDEIVPVHNQITGEDRHVSPEIATNTEALLDAGHSIRYDQILEPAQSIEEEALRRKLAWQQHALIFKGETLEAALVEIARYTDQELIIVDPSIAQLSIGGHYKQMISISC